MSLAVFHLYLFFVYLYVLWRFIKKLPLAMPSRAGIALAVLVISKYHLILQVIYGTMFSPEFSRWLVLAAEWLFCSFILLFLLVLLRDLVLLMGAFFRKPAFIRMEQGSTQIVMTSVALGLSAIGLSQAVKVPEVTRIQVEVEGLPKSFEGLRIVQLSDLHISRAFQKEWVGAVVAKVNSLHSDVVFVTGDLIDGDVEHRRADIEPLKYIEAQMDVFAILGNHEYYFDSKQWLAYLQKLNMTVLINSHVVLKRGDDELVVAGVTDEVAPSFGMDGPNLGAALEGVDPSSSVILLKHRPQDADASALAGVDLQLSGHTHGGMIKGLDALVAYANQGYVSGLYRVGAMKLYVSNGTGLWNGFLMRLGVAPEITEITFRSS